MQLKKLLLILTLSDAAAWAMGVSYSRDNYRDIRWLGRGNTGVSEIRDGSAVFYNPGGIPRIDGYNFVILNPTLGGSQNFVQSFSEVSSLTSDTRALSAKFAPFLGKPLAVQGSFFPHVAIPGLVLGLWDYLDANIVYRNPVYPTLDFDTRNDFGVITGTGFKFLRNFYAGISLRYQKRTSIIRNITSETIFAASSSILTNLQQKGNNFGLNLGLQYFVPVDGTNFFGLGAAVENVGYMTWKTSKLGTETPLRQAQMVNFGTHWEVRSRLAEAKILLDWRQATNSDLHFTKKIYGGVDVTIPFVTLRGGFFQGYWTAGFSTDFIPLFDLDMATYGEELDYAAGIRSQRIWMLGLRMGFEIRKVGGRRRQRFSIDDL